MIRNLTCIECPKGCRLTVEIEDGRAVKVSGNQCAKGERYGAAEVGNPLRVLTSCVRAEGLPLKMVPVRTDRAVPRDRLFAAMAAIRKMRLARPVRAGDVVASNFMGLGVNLIATRSSGDKE